MGPKCNHKPHCSHFQSHFHFPLCSCYSLRLTLKYIVILGCGSLYVIFKEARDDYVVTHCTTAYFFPLEDIWGDRTVVYFLLAPCWCVSVLGPGCISFCKRSERDERKCEIPEFPSCNSSNTATVGILPLWTFGWLSMFGLVHPFSDGANKCFIQSQRTNGFKLVDPGPQTIPGFIVLRWWIIFQRDNGVQNLRIRLQHVLHVSGWGMNQTKGLKYRSFLSCYVVLITLMWCFWSFCQDVPLRTVRCRTGIQCFFTSIISPNTQARTSLQWPKCVVNFLPQNLSSFWFLSQML